MNILSNTDTYYSYSGSEITYVIRLGETETAVFYGRAVKAPNEDYIYIKINDIAQQYLDVNMPDFRNLDNDLTFLSNAVIQFKLYEVQTYTTVIEGTTTIASREALLETYDVLLNYSYEDEWYGEPMVLSRPVNGHLDPRMKMVWSAYASGLNTRMEVTSVCPITGGTPTTGSTPSVDSGDTIYSGETHTFVITSGDGIEFNNDANIWLIQYETDYPSVYYVFSGSTGVSTGYTSGGQISFYIPANTESAATWEVSFYPYDGGAVLDTATSTQSDFSYTFSFNNTDGETLSSSSTSNYVSWTSTYPLIEYKFYRNGTLIGNGSTSQSGITLNYDENTDTQSAVTYLFEVYYNGELIDSLTWYQAAAEEVMPYTGTPGVYESQYLTLEFLSGGTFNYSGYAGSTEYSIDGGETWQPLAAFSVNEGDKVLLRSSGDYYSSILAPAEPPFYTLHVHHLCFNLCPDFIVYGNILSMMDGDNFRGHQDSTALGDTMFWNSKVHSAENLVLPNKVSNSCYYAMFQDCALLTHAPALPATTLAVGCYRSMFHGCTSLVNAPALPATTLAEDCYRGMFYGCFSLVNAPTLSSMNLENECYAFMFMNCTSLVNAPALPATTLAVGCYNQMFATCTSLATAPTLPAQTLVQACYRFMFYNCRNLSSITCLATDKSANLCTHGWVQYVASSGTFRKAPAATWYSNPDGNGSPSGWTIVDA